MNRAGGLLSAERRNRDRKGGGEAGRHGQSRPDHQGKEHENNKQVGEPLKQII